MSTKTLPWMLRGRLFTESDLGMIQSLIRDHPDMHRTALSQEVCRRLPWLQPNGRLKERACRVVLLRLQREAILVLPPAQGKWYPRSQTLSSTPPETSPTDATPTRMSARALMPLRFELASRPSRTPAANELLWNDLMRRCHYLGHRQMVGPQLKYLIRSATGRLLGAIGFAAAAWKLRVRDEWIGWSDAERRANLDRVINNTRFLLLPSLSAANLASHALACALRELRRDWVGRYGVRPALVETFVHRDRHRGTCYEAAGWRRLGETAGRGKWDRHTRRAEPVKIVFVRPLVRNPRQLLRLATWRAPAKQMVSSG